MHIIIPALLEPTTEALLAQIKRVVEALPNVPHLHIDIMDGHFVETKNTIDPLVLGRSEKIPKLELHLMVKDPIAYMRAWREVDSVFRVLVHHEAPGDPIHLVNFARKEGWDVGVVLNPETAFKETEEYLTKIDVLQFMTVHPGKQGAPFVPKVLEHIKAFSELHPVCEYSNEPVVCEVDGHVNSGDITELKEAGVNIFNVGSYLIQSADIKKIYDELNSLVQ